MIPLLVSILRNGSNQPLFLNFHQKPTKNDTRESSIRPSIDTPVTQLPGTVTSLLDAMSSTEPRLILFGMNMKLIHFVFIFSSGIRTCITALQSDTYKVTWQSVANTESVSHPWKTVRPKLCQKQKSIR